jgi:fatty-acyl-CoA synthase
LLLPSHQRHYAIWPKRIPRSITPPATSLWHNLAINALRFPDKPALVFFDRIFTYREVLTQAEALAATLVRMVLKKVTVSC